MTGTLREFLEIGKLGPVILGLSPEDVRHLLGEAEAVGGTAKQRIWKYGSMQLGFQRDKASRSETLAFIGLYFREENSELPEAIPVRGWFPSAGTTRKAVARYLAEQDMGFGKDVQLTFDTQAVFRTSSGASLVFDETGHLDSIQLYVSPVSQTVQQRLSKRCI